MTNTDTDAINSETTTSAMIIRVAITLAAVIMLVSHIFWPNLSIDYVSTVLIVIAALPWLPAILQSAKLPGGWEFTFREMEKKVDNHDHKIESQKRGLQSQQRVLNEQQKIINQLVVFSMSFHHYNRLKSLYLAKKNGTEYIFNKSGGTINELLYLRDHGFIGLWGIRGFADGTDISQQLEITPVGGFYVETRETYEAEAKGKVLPNAT